VCTPPPCTMRRRQSHCFFFVETKPKPLWLGRALLPVLLSSVRAFHRVRVAATSVRRQAAKDAAPKVLRLAGAVRIDGSNFFLRGMIFEFVTLDAIYYFVVGNFQFQSCYGIQKVAIRFKYAVILTSESSAELYSFILAIKIVLNKNLITTKLSIFMRRKL
jgi:hypothetical protein